MVENSCYNTRIQLQPLLLLVSFLKKKRAVAKGRMEKKMSNSICSVVFNGERSSDELKYRSFRAVLMFYLENRKIIVTLFFPIACVKMLAYTSLF